MIRNQNEAVVYEDWRNSTPVPVFQGRNEIKEEMARKKNVKFLEEYKSDFESEYKDKNPFFR